MTQTKKILVLLSFLLSSCASKSSTQEERALRRYELGMSLLKEGKSPQSILNLTEAEKLSPKNYSIKNGLALAYLARGRADLAHLKADEALSIKNNFTDALVTKAQIYIEQKKWNEAIKVLDRASSDLTFPTPSDIWELKSTCEMNLGHLEMAQNSIQEALRLSPLDCSIRYTNGKIFYERRLFVKAVKSLSETSKMCGSTVPEVQYYLGLSHYHIGNRTEALSVLNEILESRNTVLKEKATAAINSMKE